jgi:hypothetical protein
LRGFVTGEKDLEGVAKFKEGGLRTKREESLDIEDFDHLLLWWQKLSRSISVQKSKVLYSGHWH